MNCRKARSLLSAFSRDELSHSVKEKLLQHLENCPECQKHKAVADQVSDTVRQLPKHELSDDFNMKLFERIHNENRVENAPAHMPRKAPSSISYWTRVLAPAAAAAVVVIVALGVMWSEPGGNHSPVIPQGMASVPVGGIDGDVLPAAASKYQTHLKGLSLDRALYDSLTAVFASKYGNQIERLSQQKKRGFGTLGPRPLISNVNQRGSNRHYVLPTVSPNRRMVRNATY